MTEKDFKTLQAQFAMKGHQLSRFTADSDGHITLIVGRWGMFRTFDTLDACRAFLAVIGGDHDGK